MDTRVYLQLEIDAAPFLLPGTNHRLTYSAQIGYKNTQGDNSIPTHSWGGWQPPTLTFSCLIPWRKPSELLYTRGVLPHTLPSLTKCLVETSSPHPYQRAGPLETHEGRGCAGKINSLHYLSIYTGEFGVRACLLF